MPEDATDPLDGPLLRAYRLMLVSRYLDDACQRLLDDGIPLPHYHSGAGQEALMVGSALPLRSTDWYIYTHRGYGHLLAKGVSLREIALDLFIRTGGTNHGLGAVMHVARPDIGLPGREGVFGSRFGIAMGLALASSLRGEERVAVCGYGEAAGSRGPLFEALNMAVLMRLPLVLIGENNGYSFTSRTEWLYPNGRMSDVWRGFDIPVEVVDGNDVEAVMAAVTRAVDRARAGEGPSVIEGLTYRIAPHIWFDDAAYQPAAEIEQWQRKDPIQRFRSSLLERAIVDEGTLLQLEREASDAVATTIDEARTAPRPRWDDTRQVQVR